MKINKYHGIFYDTVFYMLVHFYRETLINRIFYLSDDIEHDMRFHKIITTIDLPEEIKILFYTDVNYTSFILNFYRGKIDYHEAGYDEYYKVFTDKEAIKRDFFGYYFIADENNLSAVIDHNDSKVINQLIKNSNLPDDVKHEFYSFILTIDESLNLFIRALNKLLPIIEELHEDNTDIYYEIIHLLKDKNIYDKLLKTHKCNENVNAKFSFSLMNPLSMFFSNSKHSNHFRIGEKFNYILNVENNKVNFYSIMKTLGSNQRLNILDLFLEYENLCVNDISEICRLSYHAVRNHVETLYKENIIKISFVKGNEHFYRINNQYFRKYDQISSEFYNKLIQNDYGRKFFYERIYKKTNQYTEKDDKEKMDET